MVYWKNYMANLSNTYRNIQEGTLAGRLEPKEYPNDNPNDPTVIITGFGTMLFSQLKDDVHKKLDDLAKRTKRGDFDMAIYQIVHGEAKFSQVLPHKLQAIADVEKQMSTRQWKRRITMYNKKK